MTGQQVSSGQTSLNFRIYWDGDLQDELLDGNKIDKWTGGGTSRIRTLSEGPSSTCNSTKNTPNLQADILGDWREEIILHNGADQIAIYTTNTPTNHRVPTLMHDHTYRLGIAWQNTAYNQPPHLGYYLPDAMQARMLDKEFNVMQDEPFEIVAQARYITNISVKASYAPDGTKKTSQMPAGMTRTVDTALKTFTISGVASQTGDYQIILNLKDVDSKSVADTIVVHSLPNPTGIETVGANPQTEQPAMIYDLQGRQRKEMRPGEIYIIRRDGKTIKVTN